SAAFTAPAGLSIITTSFAEGPARNKALSIYTATGATGFSLGLVFGGLLTEIGWRWVFFLPVAVAGVALVAAVRVRPGGDRRAREPRGDVPLRRLVRLPVHRHALPAAAPRLVVARDRLRDLPRRFPRRPARSADRTARRSLRRHAPDSGRDVLDRPRVRPVPA